MSIFQEYEKVQRIEKEECDGLLEGTCYIYEKVDGANAQTFFDESHNDVSFGSRNRVVGIGNNLLLNNDFRGLGKWFSQNIEEIREFFGRNKLLTVYGEWLVPHSVKYAPEYYNRFYAFDIMINGYFCHPNHPAWSILPSCFGKIPLDCVIKDAKIDDLRQYLQLPSGFGATFREGIVIKNYSFVNKFGRIPYGKLLSKDFQEAKSKPKVNIDPSDLEVELCSTYCTKARVTKICHKIKFNEVSETTDKGIDSDISGDLDKFRFGMNHIPKVINMVFYDIITEDMHDILKKFRYPTVDFKKFKALVFELSKKYFVEYIEKQN